MKIVDRGTGKWGFGVEEVAKGEKFVIEAIDIDTLLKDSGLERINILKLDVEGAEKSIFFHISKKWLEKTDIMVIELYQIAQVHYILLLKKMNGMSTKTEKR